MKLAIIIASLFYINPAQAESWDLVGSANGTINFVEVSSIYSTGDIRRAWTSAIVLGKLPFFAGKAMKVDKVLMEFDCVQRKSRTIQSVLYQEDKTPITLRGTEIPTEWSFIPPGTLGAGLIASACNEKRDLMPDGFDPLKDADRISAFIKL